MTELPRVRDLVSEDVQHLVFFSENNSLTVFTEDGVKGVCFEEVGRTRTSRASCRLGCFPQQAVEDSPEPLLEARLQMPPRVNGVAGLEGVLVVNPRERWREEVDDAAVVEVLVGTGVQEGSRGSLVPRAHARVRLLAPAARVQVAARHAAVADGGGGRQDHARRVGRALGTGRREESPQAVAPAVVVLLVPAADAVVRARREIDDVSLQCAYSPIGRRGSRLGWSRASAGGQALDVSLQPGRRCVRDREDVAVSDGRLIEEPLEADAPASGRQSEGSQVVARRRWGGDAEASQPALRGVQSSARTGQTRCTRTATGSHAARARAPPMRRGSSRRH